MAETSSIGPTATTLGIISKPLHVKILQTLAIAASTYVFGQMTTLSTMTVPALLQTRSANLLAQQFKKFFDRGVIAGPACIIPSHLIFGWLAWREPSRSTTSFKLYVTASALLFGALPWTEIIMGRTNRELLKRGSKAAQGDVEVTGKSSRIFRRVVESRTNDCEATDVEEDYKSQSTTAFFRNQSKNGLLRPEQQSTHQLVDNWAVCNLGRGIMMLGASLSGIWATINEDLSFFE